MRITVRAWKQVIDIDNLDKDDEQLENLGLTKIMEYAWTNTQISSEDILEHYEYNGSPKNNKTVIVFSDGRPKMIIKEAFDSFSERLKELEDIAFKQEQPSIYFLPGPSEDEEYDDENQEEEDKNAE